MIVKLLVWMVFDQILKVNGLFGLVNGKRTFTILLCVSQIAQMLETACQKQLILDLNGHRVHLNPSRLNQLGSMPD